MNKMLGEAAEKDNLPLTSCIVTPDAHNTFWANVIGKGFPTPRMNGTFRWCTDRLKISPSAKKITEIICNEGEEAVVLLGVRKAPGFRHRGKFSSASCIQTCEKSRRW